jgi:Cysteine-rich secretory protein family
MVGRYQFVAMAAAAAALLMLVGAAAAARQGVNGPGVKLTAAPPASTSATTAMFRWKTNRGTMHITCRLTWKRRPGSGSASPKLKSKFARCHSPSTWKHLVSGRYTLTLVAHGRHGKKQWQNYSWTIVPPPPPLLPPSATDCARSPYKYLWPVYPAISSAEQAFVNLVNQARQSLGVGPLSLDSRLSLAADSHSYWQDVEFGYSGLDHVPGCKGSDPFQRMTDAGYSANYEGEVTLVSYPPASAQFAFNLFKSSPPHWALLTSPDFTQIGVGESKYHWTADLGGS